MKLQIYYYLKNIPMEDKLCFENFSYCLKQILHKTKCYNLVNVMLFFFCFFLTFYNLVNKMFF